MGSNHRPVRSDRTALPLVGRLGVEPSTSFLSGKRSTAEPTAHKKIPFVMFYQDILLKRRGFFKTNFVNLEKW